MEAVFGVDLASSRMVFSTGDYRQKQDLKMKSQPWAPELEEFFF